MVLPATPAAALSLILIAILCFGLWPNIFKIAGKYRFELFSFDFAIGAVACGLIAAYTLGTLGSELNFGDSMLVAGRRAEVMSVVAGGFFALGNMLYLATIALLGLTNSTLVAFSVLGCVMSLLDLMRGNPLTESFAFLLLAVAAALAVTAARASRISNQPQITKPGQPRAQKAISTTTKGAITGVLAGLTFACVLPAIRVAEPGQLGIGAYGGLLMASVGIILSTFCYNFFFLNVSLEGGNLGYASYLSASVRNHLTGVVCGVVWAAGALALYVACTGTAGVMRWQAWIAPFAGALAAAISGLAFWQKSPQPAAAARNKLISTALFAAGAALLLAGMRD